MARSTDAGPSYLWSIGTTPPSREKREIELREFARSDDEGERAGSVFLSETGLLASSSEIKLSERVFPFRHPRVGAVAAATYVASVKDRKRARALGENEFQSEQERDRGHDSDFKGGFGLFRS